MSEEHEWNGLRVRRDERGKWQYDWDGDWLHFIGDRPSRAVVAELDKMYPLPRTVTLNIAGQDRTYSYQQVADGGWWHEIGRYAEHRVTLGMGCALARIWELENGDDR